MGALGIFGTLIILITVIISIIKSPSSNYLFVVLLTIIGTTLINTDTYNQGIHPIEVYRGNTELKIKQEIVNNEIVKQDTIIIWKKEKLK